jgi:HPt (histidine-containing phosphotransfer) domain-containing protein
LQVAIHQLQTDGGIDQLKRATHKVKTSLAILGKEELSQLVENIREKAFIDDHTELLVMTQQYDVMTNKIIEQLIDTARQTSI